MMHLKVKGGWSSFIYAAWGGFIETAVVNRQLGVGRAAGEDSMPALLRHGHILCLHCLYRSMIPTQSMKVGRLCHGENIYNIDLKRCT